MRNFVGGWSPLLMLWVAIAICFIQVGGNSVLSVNFLAFFVIATLTLPALFRMGASVWVVSALAFFVNLIPYMVEPNFTTIAPRSVRWFAVYLIIIAASQSKLPLEVGVEQFRKLFWFLIILVLGHSLVQSLLLAFGGNPSVAFLPYEWYGAIAGDDDGELRRTTVAAYWLEVGAEKNLMLGHELHVRPSSFYAEPSYVGFIALMCVAFIRILAKTRREEFLAFLVGFGICAVAQTAAGIFTLAVYCVYAFRHTIMNGGWTFLGLLVLAGAGLYFLDLDRLSNISDPLLEPSGYVRLIKPFDNAIQLIHDGKWFGVPPAEAPGYFSGEVGGVLLGKGLDNGLLNLFLYFGVGAFFLVFVFSKVLPGEAFVVFLLITQYNGTPMSFDKGLLLSLYLILNNTVSSRLREGFVRVR